MPTKNNMNISSTAPVLKYEIYNLQGQLLASQKVKKLNHFQINVKSLNKAVYLLKVHTTNGISLKKFHKH